MHLHLGAGSSRMSQAPSNYVCYHYGFSLLLQMIFWQNIMKKKQNNKKHSGKKRGRCS